MNGINLVVAIFTLSLNTSVMADALCGSTGNIFCKSYCESTDSEKTKISSIANAPTYCSMKPKTDPQYLNYQKWEDSCRAAGGWVDDSHAVSARSSTPPPCKHKELKKSEVLPPGATT